MDLSGKVVFSGFVSVVLCQLMSWDFFLSFFFFCTLHAVLYGSVDGICTETTLLKACPSALLCSTIPHSPPCLPRPFFLPALLTLILHTHY